MDIKFIPCLENLDIMTDPPKSATKEIPDWYKNQLNINQKNMDFGNNGVILSRGLKECIPFFDAISTGYIQKTWCDIGIKKNIDRVEFYYSNQPAPLDIRQQVHIPINDSYYDMEFTWKTYWSIDLPKGYSALITHPFNRLDLPFTTLTGVIDNFDLPIVSMQTGGNLPFYIKKDFEGIIPAGTPMFQILPFKRENWTSSVEPFNLNLMLKSRRKFGSKFYGSYRNNVWSKKKYL